MKKSHVKESVQQQSSVKCFLKVREWGVQCSQAGSEGTQWPLCVPTSLFSRAQALSADWDQAPFKLTFRVLLGLFAGS